MKVFQLVFTIFMLISASSNLYAKKFTNEYTEFELPPGWDCILEGSEWVCQSENPQRRKEAIIILVAKLKGDQDSIEKYEEYLKKSKSYTLPGGKSQISEPKYTRLKEIEGHQWVDALHLASEVPGYYTRYLATVKEDLGIAITFSVSKDHYEDYKEIFDNMVSGVKVFRQAGKLAKSENDGSIKSGDDVLDQVDLPENTDISVSTGSAQKASNGSEKDNSLYLIIGGILVVLVLLGTRGKGKKKSKKKK